MADEIPASPAGTKPPTLVKNVPDLNMIGTSIGSVATALMLLYLTLTGKSTDGINMPPVAGRCTAACPCATKPTETPSQPPVVINTPSQPAGGPTETEKKILDQIAALQSSVDALKKK